MWILGREGVDPRNSGNFYNMVVQVTLLFGADTWVMPPRIGKNLGSFHHRVDCWLAGMPARQDTTVRWVYPPLHATMTEVVLEEVDIYVLLLHNTVSQYIATQTMLELYLVAERRPGVLLI